MPPPTITTDDKELLTLSFISYLGITEASPVTPAFKGNMGLSPQR